MAIVSTIEFRSHAAWQGEQVALLKILDIGSGFYSPSDSFAVSIFRVFCNVIFGGVETDDVDVGGEQLVPVHIAADVDA